MPEKVVRGRGRIDWKGDVALVDALKDAAERLRKPWSVFVTEAFTDKLQKHGFKVPPPAPPKKRGRPRKKK